MILKDIDVHIIAGQSNAVGCTNISTLPNDFKKETFEKAYLYQEGNFSTETFAKLVKGVSLGMGCWSGQMGIEYGISKVLNNHDDKPFALIRYAFGGSSLCYDWVPRINWAHKPCFIGHRGFHYMSWSKAVYNGLMELINKGYKPTIKSLIWMQGETDAGLNESIANEYYDSLRDLIFSMRTELNLPELKIIVGEIATKAPQVPYSDVVRNAQKKFCETDKNSYLVSTKDIPIGKDGLHFDGEEDIKLGEAFGKAIIKSL